MHDDNAFSGRESLQLIETMINKAKNQFNEDGHLYLLWGWVVLLCSISQFILLHYLKYERHYLVWLLTCFVVIYQVIYLLRKRRQETVKTYTDDIIGFVWITFVISMLLIGFILVKGGATKAYTIINPAFLALYGIPTLLSGVILRFTPLKVGGICCWVLSIAATFARYDVQLLFIAAAMLVAWIIPGYLLKAKSRKLNH
jgi:hypothetical protein